MIKEELEKLRKSRNIFEKLNETFKNTKFIDSCDPDYYPYY